MRHFGHRSNIVFDQAVIAALQGADVDDHVNFARAVHDRSARFVGFHVGQGRAQGKSDNGADGDTAALQLTGRYAHPGWIHADRSEVILGSFFAKTIDFAFRRVRFQKSVVDQTGPVAR